jgi:hypothetical protein
VHADPTDARILRRYGPRDAKAGARRHRLQGRRSHPPRTCRGRADGGGEGEGPYFIPAERIPDWRGDVVVIVAGGPSAGDIDLAAGRASARFLCVNEAWRLAPWAEALYACDAAWWKARAGVPEFQGLKIAHDATACVAYRDIVQTHIARGVDKILTETVGITGDGGNSGFQALNIAVQFGATRIVLVGYDMRIDRGLHWHGPHPKGLNNPSEQVLARWRRALDGTAETLAGLGVEVLNASPVSALKAYPIMDFEKAIAC